MNSNKKEKLLFTQDSLLGLTAQALSRKLQPNQIQKYFAASKSLFPINNQKNLLGLFFGKKSSISINSTYKTIKSDSNIGKVQLGSFDSDKNN